MSKTLLAVFLLLITLGGLSGLAAQTPAQGPVRSAPDFKKAEFSLHIGTIPISWTDDIGNGIFTFALRVDLRSMKSISLAPELVVLANFSGAFLLVPGLTFNYWLGPLNLGVGASFPIYGGFAFLPKFSAGWRLGHVVLSGYIHTFFSEGLIWGASIGYVF